jgi:hypothetical protein
MLLKRLRIALDLSVRFLFDPKTLTVAAIPIIAWPLKRLFVDHTSLRHDVTLLAGIYATFCAGVFVWQFVAAGGVISREPAYYAELAKLDAQEQSELRRLIRAGSMPVGSALLERVAAKTNFIYRDLSGEWRIERDYRRFLKTWREGSQTK